MAAGFVALLLFAVLALFVADDSTERIIAGALGVISGALSGFIGRTFVRAQESAANHLQAYFDQPLKFSRYLAAERLISQMTELSAEKRRALEGEFLQAVVGPYAVLAGEPRASAAEVSSQRDTGGHWATSEERHRGGGLFGYLSRWRGA